MLIGINPYGAEANLLWGTGTTSVHTQNNAAFTERVNVGTTHDRCNVRGSTLNV